MATKLIETFFVLIPTMYFGGIMGDIFTDFKYTKWLTPIIYTSGCLLLLSAVAGIMAKIWGA